MKTANADILILPGLGGGNANYWYERWGKKLRTAKRVEQENWDTPNFEDWKKRLTTAVEQAEQPVVLVAHSLGVLLAVHAAPTFPHQKVAGGYFVAPPDIETLEGEFPALQSFAPIPRAPMAFPSILVASENDPYCPFDRAEDFSYAWGSKFETAGQSGHINEESGQGPWPEGLLSFANFMAQL